MYVMLGFRFVGSEVKTKYNQKDPIFKTLEKQQVHAIEYICIYQTTFNDGNSL